jgi:site-specific recombinase XerD
MKKIEKNILVAPLLQAYFTEGLINERNASPQTIESYSYTFYLLMAYSRKMLKKVLSEITLAELNATFIRNFLKHLESDRRLKPQSRNQRLAAIRSFFKYISPQVPQMAATVGQVLAIKGRKTSQDLVHFLTPQEVKALLVCQNLDTWIGRRDHNLILLAIETGLRLSEILLLTWQDIHIAGHYGYVRCVGKGRKEREVILSREMSRILKSWERETSQLSPAGFIFPNIFGESMSSDLFQWLLKKYARQAEKHCLSLKDKKVSPHVLRHTAAMNLRNAGVDLLTIASMLGHKSIETTQVYLEVDNKRQEETLNLLVPNKTRVPRFRSKDNLEAFLKSLRPQKKT